MSNSQNAVVKKLSISGFGEKESMAELGGNITTVLSIDFYENIFEPVTELVCIFTSSASALSDIQIRGTENVSLKVEHPTGTLEVDNWRLISFNQMESESTVNTFMITCNHKDVIANERKRVTKRYEPKTKSSSHVEEILKTHMNTELEVDIEPTANADGFLGNYWKPYRAIYWLARRALSGASPGDGGGTDMAGFLFWMTRSGYKFKSIDTIISEAINDKKSIPVFNQNEVVDSDSIDENFNMYNVRSENDQNVVGKMQNSFYGETRKTVNLFSLYPDTDHVDKSKAELNQTTAGDSDAKELENNDELNTRPTVHTTFVYAPGTLEMDGKIEMDDYNPTKVLSQSKMRYESLLSQSLRATVPYNLKLEAGDVIEANLIQSGKGTDQWNSGYYLIKDLRHSFFFNDSGVQCYTYLRLVRDSPGKR